MSASNGDKSRFHRKRKERIARRKRNRELRNPAAGKANEVESPAKIKAVSV